MAQKSIELILFRQLSSYLAMPAFIFGTNGDLIFCNEAAEDVIGFKFSDTGELTAKEWSTIFSPQDKDGHPIEMDKLPLSLSVQERHPAYGKFYIRTVQNILLHIEMVSLPIINAMGRFQGAVSFFQETPK